MAMISDRDVAVRLARAIVADIRLYNDAAIASGRSLAPEIDEGRALFRARVIEELHAVFEDEIAALAVSTTNAPGAPAPAAPPSPIASASGAQPSGDSDPTNGRIVVAIGVLVALFLAIGWRTFGPP